MHCNNFGDARIPSPPSSAGLLELFGVLVAIATVHGATQYLETARRVIADLVRDAVRNVLGPNARYLRRTTDNPIEVEPTSP